jgi:hypothetical protein
VGRQHERAVGERGEPLAMARRHGEPPFRVQIQRCRPLKHPSPSEYGKRKRPFSHFFPLFPTLDEFYCRVKQEIAIFSSRNKDLRGRIKTKSGKNILNNQL